MARPLHLGADQQALIDDVRGCMRGGPITHVRIFGEPGVGKTRLALEATDTEDLAPLVVYVPSAEGLLGGERLNLILAEDEGLFVILVVDECSKRDRAPVWNLLKPHSHRCRLITLDHGPERSTDEKMRVLHCPQLSEERLADIIQEYVPSKFEASRWARLCGGSPRVAHAVGDNLKRNPQDPLAEPSTAGMWDRFICGLEDPESDGARRKRRVLRHVALFERFGFEPPVQGEAREIANLASKADPSITWPVFQETVRDLQERRILQGSTTLFITPRLLHVYLWTEFWNKHGRGFDSLGFLQHLPGQMVRWFVTMLQYGGSSNVAKEHVRGWLRAGGSLDSLDVLKSQEGAFLIYQLAEAVPDECLGYLRRVLQRESVETLRDLSLGRQYLVWALEKIAVWKESFAEAASLLPLLAESDETSINHNNALGTFTGLFVIAPGGLSATEAPPATRLPVLRAALESDRTAHRRIGLEACRKALSTTACSRIIGLEHQGLRPEAKLWVPRTYGDLFDAWRSVWQLLVEMSATWNSKQERTEANRVLVEAAEQLVQIPSLADEVLDTLGRIVADEATDLRDVVEFIYFVRKYGLDDLSPEQLARVDALDRQLTGTSFSTKLRRHVLLGEARVVYSPDTRDEVEEGIRGLARQAVESRTLFDQELEDLSKSTTPQTFIFGRLLAELDANRDLWDATLQGLAAAGEEASASLVGGYLAGIRMADEEEWEQSVSLLITDHRFRGVLAGVLWNTGLTDSLLRQLIDLYEEGDLRFPDLGSVACRAPADTDETLIQRLLVLLMEDEDPKGIVIALELCDLFYCREKPTRNLPEAIALQLLSNERVAEALRTPTNNYHWGKTAEKLRLTSGERALELLRAVLAWPIDAWHKVHIDHGERALENIVKAMPEQAWAVIRSSLDDPGSRASHAARDLLRADRYFQGPSMGLVHHIPPDLLWEWIDEDPPRRAPLMAEVMPQTLGRSAPGKLTEAFLDRYGHVERLSHSLFLRFHTGGWTGSASEHFRSLQEEAHQWLADSKSEAAHAWTAEYISHLGREIKRSEVEEERTW